MRALRTLFTLLVLIASAARGDAPAEAILGNWLTQEHDGVVRIVRRADGRFDGIIVAGRDIDRPDRLNPDVALRGQWLRGEAIVRGLRYDGDGKYSNGTVYDPDSGHTYRCRAELENQTLRLRGFLGISLLGRTQTWTRYAGPVPGPRTPAPPAR